MATDSTDTVQERGPRALKLQEILQTSLRQTLRACSYEKLESCFPTLAKNDPETLKHAREQVIDFLTKACQSEFEKIIAERDATKRLNELDQLINDARRRKEEGQSPNDSTTDLSPSSLLRAHMVPVKRQELASLNNAINTLQRQNAEGLTTIDEQRQRIEQQSKTLRSALQTLESSETIWQT